MSAVSSVPAQESAAPVPGGVQVSIQEIADNAGENTQELDSAVSLEQLERQQASMSSQLDVGVDGDGDGDPSSTTGGGLQQDSSVVGLAEEELGEPGDADDNESEPNQPTEQVPKLTAAEREIKVNTLRTVGKEALAKHDFAAAIDALSAALKLQSDSFKLHRLRCVAYACMQNFEASFADAQRVVELNPTSTDGYYYMGFALYHQKKYAQSAHAFKDGLERNPSDSVLQQGFWDALTLMSQHRMTLPLEGEAADRALRDSEKANTPMDEELAEELADTLIPTVVSPGGGYVGGDTPAPTAREAMAEQSEPKLSDKTSLQLESADATGFTASMSMM
ncbi:hypothetical protein RI054_19g86700 [Pseudoscourfieldia marina]